MTRNPMLWLIVALVCVSFSASAFALARVQRSQSSLRTALCAVRDNAETSAARRSYLLAHPALERVLGFTAASDARRLAELKGQIQALQAVGCP